MQIYPAKHDIKMTSKVNLETDIPLAYIDTEHKDYKADIRSVLPSSNSVTRVMPYQRFDSYDIKLFRYKSGDDKDSRNYEEVDTTRILQRDGDGYFYIPNNSITFTPQRFSYEIIAKKKLKYKTSKTYNMKVGCSDISLAENLIKLFGDAPDRKTCPPNIWANNKDVAHTSLIPHSFAELDFMFIETDDNKHYKGTKEAIDSNALLESATNVWHITNKMPFTSVEGQTEIKETMIYNEVVIDNSLILNSSITDKKDCVVHHLFKGTATPVVIYEHKEKGFEIYTKKSFFDSINKNLKVFYEVLFYVYANSYRKTEPVVDWITDVTPDYVAVEKDKLTTKDKFLSKKRINEFFNLAADEVNFINAKIDQPNVVIKSFINNYIVFEKKYTDAFSKYADPVKPAGSISIFTPRQDVIYFDEFVYLIEDNITTKVTCERHQNSYDITVNDFKHSLSNINLKNTGQNQVNVPLTKVIDYQEVAIEKIDLYICITNNLLYYVEVSDYNSEYGTAICQVTIEKVDSEVQLYDMRRRGGGLHESQKDDYSLLDIGHVYGLAYRKSGALVIKLPERLKQHQELIEAVVQKHITAEKYPILIFEKEDDDNERNKQKLLERWSINR